MCGVNMETVYFVSGAQPLMPEFDFDSVMKALAMMMNCPVVSSLSPSSRATCVPPFYTRMRFQSHFLDPGPYAQQLKADIADDLCVAASAKSLSP
jgi:hypothetical protein